MTGRDKIGTATSSASLYDNVNNVPGGATAGPKILKTGDSIKRKDTQQQNETCQTNPKTANVGIGTTNVGSQVCRSRWFLLDLSNFLLYNIFDFIRCFCWISFDDHHYDSRFFFSELYCGFVCVCVFEGLDLNWLSTLLFGLRFCTADGFMYVTRFIT